MKGTCWLPARQPRQKINLAMRGNRLEPCVPVNFAVDRYRKPAVDLRLESRIGLAEPGQELPDIGSLDLDALLPARKGFERPPQHHFHHHLLQAWREQVMRPARSPSALSAATSVCRSAVPWLPPIPHWQRPPAAGRSMFHQHRARHTDVPGSA